MEEARKSAKSNGKTTYVSERACSRGHEPIRYASNGICVACDTLIYAPRRRAKNPKPRKKAIGICDHCGASFTKTNNANRYCSMECRFWSKVDVGTDTQCWEWTAAKTVDGYGSFKAGSGKLGANVGAHRHSYEMAHGEIGGSETLVCHHCDNPGCVNPSHLFLGEALDNRTDASRKGRLDHFEGHSHAFPAKGVEKIKAMRDRGMSQQAIADELGVSQQTISKYLIDAGIRERPSFWKDAHREKEVIAMLEGGAGVTETARELGVSYRYVRHLKQE